MISGVDIKDMASDEDPRAAREWYKEVTKQIEKSLPFGKAYEESMKLLRADTPSPSEGLKNDQDKSRTDLVDAEFIEGIGNVLGFGAKKYAPHNWRKGIHFSRVIGAAYRHLGAINKGEDVDPESGLSHVYHLGCCIMFLSWFMNHKPEFDDRFKYDK